MIFKLTSKTHTINVTEVTMTNTFMGMSYSDTEYIYYTYDGNFPVTKNYDNITEYYEYQ